MTSEEIPLTKIYMFEFVDQINAKLFYDGVIAVQAIGLVLMLTWLYRQWRDL